MTPEQRQKQITKTSIIGIIANVVLAVFKITVGTISGSIAIVLDAVNSLTDAVSSVVTIIGVKLASRKPDTNHPFGYGRIEYFSAIIIAGIVLSAGVTSFVESFQKVIHPELPDYTSVTIIVVIAAVLVKIVLGKYVKAQGVKYNSDSLIASGQDASFDAILSASTLLGAVFSLLFNISIDGIIGVVIAGFIIKAGIEMLLEPINSVIGTRPDSAVTIAMKKSIKEVDGVKGAYDLVIHNYGPNAALGSVHVEVDATLTADEIHHLTANIQSKILNEFQVFLTVGIYAVDDTRGENTIISDICMTHEGIIGVHGIHIDDDEKFVSFDIVLDFSVKDKNELVKVLIKEIKEKIFSDFIIQINIDTNYSG
ncbi:MAG: cation diffusion facilitator family transporter [Eubacterium sp.]|nr:cation diffusion facilitator family transporter [Eubacterium sp.]